jgi:hypothetical protein
VTAGVDAAGALASNRRTGSFTIPPREGDLFVFGRPPGASVGHDAWTTHILEAAPFAQADVTLGPVTVTGGARASALLVETSAISPPVGTNPPVGRSSLGVSVDPRVSARVRAHERLVVFAAAGLYHQPPEADDLSAVFGTPTLGSSVARHYAVGESLDAGHGFRVEATVFARDESDVVVRTELASPVLARALVQNGDARAGGVQIFVRRALGEGFFAWASYTLSRSERRYQGEPWRLSDFDEPHVLTLIASKELGPWTFGARFRYASGLPRTPVVGAYYDARADAYDPLFGPHNGSRLPPFYALDARVDYRFRAGPRAAVDVYADLQNVTFHANAEEIVYASDYRKKGFITGLPALAVVGARVDFE